jgi:hypothetical protein
VSLLPLDALRIALAPDRVDLVRLERGWRGLSIGTQHSIACEPAAGAAPWRAAIDALAQALAQARGRARSARVVLSDAFARYLLVPWRTDLRNESEIEALARMRFREIHGAAADDWVIRLAPTRYGAPYVACAVDHELLRALAAAHLKEKLRLASVRPLLIATYERWRSTRAAGDCWFAVCARGRLTLCRIEGGTWRSVRSEKSHGDTARELQLALERESLALCIDPAGAVLHLFAPEQARLATDAVAGMEVSVYAPLPGVEPRYAMALV